ncbi:MAG: TolC family protein [Candidatus Eremiobacteraeota bacterium]|nr:TolC family protein [Candidatus Eremiobacteraeota bacterium]MCW5868820.1 TolC family protein [Candidatus Eremiobacteraeota bacterium]
MKKLQVAAGLILSTTLAFADPAPVLTLNQALQMASGRNLQVLASGKEVERQNSIWDANAATRLPKIAMEARHTRLLTPISFNVDPGTLGNFPGIGPIPAQPVSISNVGGSQNSIQLTVTQPLTQLHKITLGLEAQEQAIEDATQKNRGDSIHVAVQVQDAYLSLVDTQNALVAARDSLEFTQEMERVTQEYLKEKTVLKADLLDVQTSRAEQEAQLATLQRTYQTQKEQLNYLLARDLNTDFTVQMPTISREVSQTITELEAQAQAQRPDLAQARARLKQALINTEIARAAYIPDVGVQFGYLHNGNSGLLPGTYLTVALVATWDIFDWGGREANVRARAQQAEEISLQTEDARQRAALEVAQKFRAVENLRALEAAKKLQVEAAEEHHRVALAQYQVKATLASEVLNTQAKLSSARRDYQKWQIDLAQSVAELYQAVGQAP